MPYCIYCYEFFCKQTLSSPREDCECGENMGIDDAREHYFDYEREPTEDELEEKRAERRTA